MKDNLIEMRFSDENDFFRDVKKWNYIIIKLNYSFL